jgi:hypothetical protein
VTTSCSRVSLGSGGMKRLAGGVGDGRGVRRNFVVDDRFMIRMLEDDDNNEKSRMSQIYMNTGY